MFIRYKKIGKSTYAYEVRAYWDPKTGKPRQKTRYLGKVLDEEKKRVEKVLYTKHMEKRILDLGDVYFLSHVY